MRDAAPSVWYLRHSPTDAGWWRTAAYENDEHDDGDAIEQKDGAPLPAGWVWRSVETGHGIMRIEYTPPNASAPPLWFVNVDEPKAEHPATNLVAFATDDREPGTIVSRYTFATMGVDNDAQVGAVRWYRSGVVHQIFVAPEWRQHGVATSIFIAASGFHQSNGWPQYLRSDGRRTKLGSLLAAGFRYTRRVAILDQTMPPMDLPPGAAESNRTRRP